MAPDCKNSNEKLSYRTNTVNICISLLAEAEWYKKKIKYLRQPQKSWTFRCIFCSFGCAVMGVTPGTPSMKVGFLTCISRLRRRPLTIKRLSDNRFPFNNLPLTFTLNFCTSLTAIKSYISSTLLITWSEDINFSLYLHATTDLLPPAFPALSEELLPSSSSPPSPLLSSYSEEW